MGGGVGSGINICLHPRPPVVLLAVTPGGIPGERVSGAGLILLVDRKFFHTFNI